MLKAEKRLQTIGFVDVFEIFVGVYGQLTASRLIAGDGGIVMQLKRGNGPLRIHAALNAVRQSACLIVTVDDQ